MTPADIERWARECIAEDWEDHVPGFYRSMNIALFARMAFAAGRAAALEEAAKVCDDVAEPAYFTYENPNTFDDGLSACAAAIRSLAKEPQK